MANDCGEIGANNRRLLELVASRQELVLKNPAAFFPWRRPCAVKTLLVTDGILDFGLGDFGLSTFVDSLVHDGRSYVRFELTLAHLRTSVGGAAVQQGSPEIAGSIIGFEFDNPKHFTPQMYDAVWLFGFEDALYFNSAIYANRAADQLRFKPDRLGDSELSALTEHMNRGGGLFATGDHGSIGRGLCGSVDRIRNMRHWNDFGAGQVSMNTAMRNDSNQLGEPGTQFSDQSDDIPQPLDLKLYSTWSGVLRTARYPHPVMCGRLGRIDVFPDHPHEGEVRTPNDLTLACRDGSAEYPPATDGGVVAPEPEIVAWGHVAAGNTAVINNTSTKQPTQAHRFGVVSTYDGHRAGVGRVVCDSTWHHFVNVNLIGVVEGGQFDDFPSSNPADPGTPGTALSKHCGFLSSNAGRLALDKIREYYVNVAAWISTTERIDCMNSRFWWDLIWSDRIVEATLQQTDQRLESVSLNNLLHIGIHARDVLGRLAGQCQTIRWMLPWFAEIYEELIPEIDPWIPWRTQREEPLRLPFVDLQPLLDITIGGALVALRATHPYPPADPDELDALNDAPARRGAVESLRRGLEEMALDLRITSELIEVGRRRLEE